MAQDPLFIVMAIAMLAVVGILLFGIGSFAKGGDFNKKYANKAMRWRIAAQFVAVLLILLFVFIRRQTTGEG
ncbi:twin transmembrane helix small protein [Dinoroseobacter sp. S76]|uniref:twin transmembrane helix small protein n=1 Tax=Dinoroseobacter sp. S76 TaxID=3415124 RepID=UPI003C7AF070